jgi:DNA-binding XRE family transcriptional regulator
MRQHDLLELLGIRERQVRHTRSDQTRLYKRIRTPVPKSPTTLGQHIHRKRLNERLIQRQLADQLGVLRATLGAWEADHYQPEGKIRAKITAWLGFDPRNLE